MRFGDYVFTVTTPKPFDRELVAWPLESPPEQTAIARSAVAYFCAYLYLGCTPYWPGAACAVH